MTDKNEAEFLAIAQEVRALRELLAERLPDPKAPIVVEGQCATTWFPEPDHPTQCQQPAGHFGPCEPPT